MIDIQKLSSKMSVTQQRMEMLLQKSGIDTSADLSPEDEGKLRAACQYLQQHGGGDIDAAIAFAFGRQTEPHRPEPPRKKSDGGGLVEARNAANEARALQAARYKEAAKETTRQTVQNAQKMGAQQADVASAAYLAGFVARSADNLQQSAMFFDMVYNASEEAIGEGASEVFTLEGAETMAALPPNNWTF